MNVPFIDPTIVKNTTNTNQISYPSLKFKKYTSFGFDYPPILKLEIVSDIDQYGNLKQTLVPDTVDTPISRIWNNKEISIDFIDTKKTKKTKKTNEMLTESIITDERKEKIRLRLIKKLKNKSMLKPSSDI